MYRVRNRLLKRQLKKIGISEEKLPKEAEWEDFLKKIEEAYQQIDQERYLNERSLEISNREMREQHKRNIHTARLASLGEMSAGIAHEINNPLTIISGYAQNLQRLIKKDEFSLKDLSKGLSRINETVMRITKIVRSLKSFARTDSEKKFEAHSVREVLEDTTDLCQEKFSSHGIKLLINITEELQIRCVRHQISQVILNLLNNSFDAIKDLSEKERWIKIKVSKESDYLVIRVGDGGPVPHEEIIDKMFEPFYTTKEVGVGTGLGLSISLGIIKSHNGEFKIDSKSSTTTFIISLPL